MLALLKRVTGLDSKIPPTVSPVAHFGFSPLKQTPSRSQVINYLLEQHNLIYQQLLHIEHFAQHDNCHTEQLCQVLGQLEALLREHSMVEDNHVYRQMKIAANPEAQKRAEACSHFELEDLKQFHAFFMQYSKSSLDRDEQLGFRFEFKQFAERLINHMEHEEEEVFPRFLGKPLD